MKSNLLFMLLGAALMFAVLKIIQPNNVSTATEKAELATINTHLNSTESGVQLSNSANKTSSKNEQCEPTDRQLAQSNDSTEQGAIEDELVKQAALQQEQEWSTYLVKHQARRANKFFRTVLGDKNNKLDQLSEFAKIKIEADLTRMNELSNDAEHVQSFQNILLKDESELNAREQAIKDEWEERHQRHQTQEESDRVQYEDSVRNLLSPSELDKYREREAAVAHQQFSETVESIANGYLDSLPDLNDYQRDELNRIVQEAQAQAPVSVPIGSTLNEWSFGSSGFDDPNNRYNTFTQAIDQTLSEQQRSLIQEQGLHLINTDEDD